MLTWGGGGGEVSVCGGFDFSEEFLFEIGHPRTNIRMQGTVNENAASIRRICQRSNKPKMKSTIRKQGLTTA